MIKKRCRLLLCLLCLNVSFAEFIRGLEDDSSSLDGNHFGGSLFHRSKPHNGWLGFGDGSATSFGGFVIDVANDGNSGLFGNPYNFGGGLSDAHVFGSTDGKTGGFADAFAMPKANQQGTAAEDQEVATPKCPNGPATYFPGNLTVTLGGGLATDTLLASTGLNGRVLTREGEKVLLNEGTHQSASSMHYRADGAGTVPDDSNPNRYFLVSNSETSSGGVGILHFDATKTPHDVIGYRRTAEFSPTGSRNCGGGRTPWGTWLSSEESKTGLVYEIDPNETPGNDYCLSPIVPPEGGNYESNAVWASPNDNKYHFYTTNDATSSYRLTRFIPTDDIDTMLAKPRKLDRLCNAKGNLSYLQLICTKNCGSSNPSGTYSWSNSRIPGYWDQAYPSAEGIDVKGDELYFVTKGQKRLYIVDLTSDTWISTGTIQSDTGETFSPDQISRITRSNSPDDLLYFAEDGSGTADIHARGMDQNGEYRFFTIIQGYSTTETSGLTFSPDNKYMYFAHQGASEIWQIWREDGCTFGNGVYLDVNYHEFVSRYLRY